MTGFHTYRLAPGGDRFAQLAAEVDFEDITKGRVGNHLVDVSDRGVPIVRTTTRYTKPAHCFSPTHRDIVAAIARAASEDGAAQTPGLSFNNALIEVYDRAYYKMGYHSDQALDLQEGSCIALYSCYEHPERSANLRTLKIKDKTTNEETSILLEHDSVVVFSLETNSRYSHKIVLDPVPSPSSPDPDNRWLGITFRRSDTYITFEDGSPRFADGAAFTLADETQRKTFYKLRGQENRSMEFDYPRLDYTLSEADLLEPIR